MQVSYADVNGLLSHRVHPEHGDATARAAAIIRTMALQPAHAMPPCVSGASFGLIHRADRSQAGRALTRADA
jgi:hypothetical protein